MHRVLGVPDRTWLTRLGDRQGLPPSGLGDNDYMNEGVLQAHRYQRAGHRPEAILRGLTDAVVRTLASTLDYNTRTRRQREARREQEGAYVVGRDGRAYTWAEFTGILSQRAGPEMMRELVPRALQSSASLQAIIERLRRTLQTRAPGETTPPRSGGDGSDDPSPPDDHPGPRPHRRDDPEGDGSGGATSTRHPGNPPPQNPSATHAGEPGRRGSQPGSGGQQRSSKQQDSSLGMAGSHSPVRHSSAEDIEAYMAVNPAPLALSPNLDDPGALAYMAQRLKDNPAHHGDRRNERVRAPVIRTEDRVVWVDGKPLRGTAILDSGAMPLLIGLPGLEQLRLGKDDILPDAVRLGLADGKTTKRFGVTRKPIKFTFNPGGQTETSVSVRAVVTQAPYDFLVGNVVLWSIGGIIDGWREQFRYQVNWRARAVTGGWNGGICPNSL